MSRNKKLISWLDQKYREWMNEEGTRKSLRQFSIYLDVSYTLLSRWMNGERSPGNENVIKIGNKLGWEIYDILGWERPTKPNK